MASRKRGNLAAVPDKSHPPPPDLRDGLDQALVELDQLWRLVHDMGDERDVFRKRLERLEAKCEVAKMLGWFGPQLQGVLRDLGGASVARKAMEKKNPIGGRLGAIREGLPKPRPDADSPGE